MSPQLLCFLLDPQPFCPRKWFRQVVAVAVAVAVAGPTKVGTITTITTTIGLGSNAAFTTVTAGDRSKDVFYITQSATCEPQQVIRRVLVIAAKHLTQSVLGVSPLMVTVQKHQVSTPGSE